MLLVHEISLFQHCRYAVVATCLGQCRLHLPVWRHILHMARIDCRPNIKYKELYPCGRRECSGKGKVETCRYCKRKFHVAEGNAVGKICGMHGRSYMYKSTNLLLSKCSMRHLRRRNAHFGAFKRVSVTANTLFTESYKRDYRCTDTACVLGPGNRACAQSLRHGGMAHLACLDAHNTKRVFCYCGRGM